MGTLAFVFSSGWASGLNCYLVVLVLGIADRVHDTEQVPNVLARWDVLAVAGFLYAMEFVADKIPYIDSAWDAISTVIRPTVGAILAALLSGEAGTLQQALIATTGGVVALLSHAVKSSLRLAINTSPEPVTNIAASSGEDVAVAGVVSLAAFHPEVALVIAGVLLVLGLVAVYFGFRFIRRGYARFKAWRDKRSPLTGSSAV